MKNTEAVYAARAQGLPLGEQVNGIFSFDLEVRPPAGVDPDPEDGYPLYDVAVRVYRGWSAEKENRPIAVFHEMHRVR